jgi:multidrug transporter EmrE-like cation transporter
LHVVFAVVLACGQILFKAAAQSIRGPVGFDIQTLLHLASNPYLLLSLVIYGLAALFWVLLLREIELNKAYLVIALALVLVPLAGTFLFGEPFRSPPAYRTGYYSYRAGIVTFDADLQHRPEDVPLLLTALIRLGADFALGSRSLGEAVNLGLSRKLLLKAAVLFTQLTSEDHRRP